MDNLQTALAAAQAAGFSHVGPLDPATINLRSEVRDMCAVNKCGRYDTNWACPPGCGELDELRAKIAKYSQGIIVQSTAELEDAFDMETTMDTAKLHGERFRKLVDSLSEKIPGALFMGAGTCSNCDTCTYPDEPCRFPDKMTSSMEAYGMVVSDVCKDNGIDYYYGKNTITYSGCVVF